MIKQPVTTDLPFDVTIAGESFNATRIDSPSKESIGQDYTYAN